MNVKPIVMAVSLTIAAATMMPAYAVQPSEVLPDAAMEQRARDISKELRCLVCRNENIDESNADLATDLRLLVRERLVAGDSDTQVIDYVVARYGEYVLLKPTLTGANGALWLAGPMVFFMASVVVFGKLRKRKKEAMPSELTDDEKKRLDALMDDL